jgi:hypothetical protein
VAGERSKATARGRALSARLFLADTQDMSSSRGRLSVNHLPHVGICAAIACVAVALAGCSGINEDRSGPLQIPLRALANGAPPGKHAYWLGPKFHDARVHFAGGSWTGCAMLNYQHVDDGKFVLDVDVQTFPALAHGDQPKIYLATVHTTTGQDVVLRFNEPAHPNTALLRDIKAAIQPIPKDVTYTGNTP